MRKILTAGLFLFLPLMLAGQTSTVEEVLVIKVPNLSTGGNFCFENPKGSVMITGYNGEVILVTAKLRYSKIESSGDDKLRKLNQYPFEMSAEIRGDKVVLLCESNGKTVDFDIKLPQNFSLNIKSKDNGDVKIVKVNADIDVENPHGDIILLGIIGSANLSSVEGSIYADFKEIDSTKPIMISTLEGDLSLGIPEESKLSFKLKSTEKEILTDLNIVRLNRGSIINQKEDKKVFVMDDWTKGTLNGGGALCTMNTYYGNITIKKR